jgi:lysophospholipase L1-like esterase
MASDAAGTTRTCGFSVIVTAQVSPRLSRTKFLSFGDSLTAGEVTVPTTAARDGQPNYRLVIVPAAAYPAQLLTLLRGRYLSQSTTIEVINAGLSGEWAEDGALRLPGVLTTQKPESVLLLEGLNDLAAQGSLGITRGARAIDTMATEVRSRGMRLFIATLPPPRPGAFRAVDQQLIMSLNSRIRITAMGQNAVLVDVFPEFLMDVNRYVGIDGLHLTEAGYAKLAELFFNAIRTDLEVR